MEVAGENGKKKINEGEVSIGGKLKGRWNGEEEMLGDARRGDQIPIKASAERRINNSQNSFFPDIYTDSFVL